MEGSEEETELEDFFSIQASPLLPQDPESYFSTTNFLLHYHGCSMRFAESEELERRILLNDIN